MKKGLLVLFLGCTLGAWGQGALGEVVGEVVDLKSGEIVYGAEVFIDDNGTRYRSRTDVDGRFRISAVPAGTHFLSIRYASDTMPNIRVEVPMDGIANTGIIEFTSNILTIATMNAKADDGRMKLVYGSLPTKEITSEDIVNSSAKNDIKGLLTSISTDVRMTNDGELVFRGARKGDMLYLMDGVKTSEVGTVPSSSIARMKVFSGGLPAKYGDTLGGVVVMESKSYFDLYRKWEAEQIRDGLR